MSRATRHLLLGLAVLASLAANSWAEILVTNFLSNNVARFSSSGTYLGDLTGAPLIHGPLATRLGPDGLLYVTSEGSDSVLRYNPFTFSYVDTFVTPGSGGLDEPTGVTWGPDGNMYVASFVGNRVQRYNGTTGASMGAFGGVITRPRVIVFRAGSMFVTSESTNAVREHNATTGTFIRNFVAQGSGGLRVPIGMAFDESFLYVTSGQNDNVLRYNGLTGAFIDVFASGATAPIDAPTFVTVIPEPATASVLVLVCAAVRRRR